MSEIAAIRSMDTIMPRPVSVLTAWQVLARVRVGVVRPAFDVAPAYSPARSHSSHAGTPSPRATCMMVSMVALYSPRSSAP
jgi:hypothetical protein